MLTSLRQLTTVAGICHWLWFGVLCLILPSLSSAETVSDVRVLIDVSGSMKTNDPQNLRAPAVRMLVGLMPEGTRSGIWTFGRYVNMQVSLADVDKQWKQQAMLEADKIHSRGLYTNIEEAIQRSTADWQTPDPRYKRHLILLTDGMVDIDKDEKLNKQSRQRILQQLLPRIESADAAIHTIALSKNADTELLTALSGATKGAFEQVDSADQLQRIFFKLFEKSVKPDTLPLEDNKFTVDKHVSDFTVLVFLAKDSPATSLQLPGGAKWTNQSHPDTVSWHHEDGYDLISVKEPPSGEWLLQAKLDPDNRVMVVTNLRLNVDKLPNTIMLGDQFDVRARLLEDGKTVNNENLLAKTQFEIKNVDQQDRVSGTELLDSGNKPDVIKGDGVYSASISNIDKAGSYELSVLAKSQTFTREMRHSLQVHDSPATYKITRAAEDQPFVITVQPHAGLIRPDTVSMQIKLPDGEPQIMKQIDDLQWSIDVPAGYANKTFILTLAGNRYSDEQIKKEFEQLLAVTDGMQSLAIKPAAAKPVEQPAPVVEEKPATDEAEVADPAVAVEQNGFSWAIVLTIIVVVNLLVIGGGWFVYRTWRKRQLAQDEAVEAELEK